MPDFAEPFDIFLPPPDDPIECIRRFAHDLALGAVHGLWSAQILANITHGTGTPTWEHEPAIRQYLDTIWIKQGHPQPPLEILESFGYIRDEGNGYWQLTEKAFNLLEASPPMEIFISYHRASSSSLAMFIWAELRAMGFLPFIDIRNIAPGDEWYDVLKKRVMGSNVFLSIIGMDTLTSDYVRKEIEWALATPGMRIIPILHAHCTPDHLQAAFPDLARRNVIFLPEDTSAELYKAVEAVKAALMTASGRRMG